MQHVYEVQEGDSPAKIAIQFAGCPKCAVDLVRANPHKPAVRHPNGFTTFQSLQPGERLWLPDKWFDGSMDALPAEYYASLPYADGVTRAHVGTLGDYPELDAATSKVGALAAMDDTTFSNSVGDVGTAINAAVQEAYGSTTKPAAAQLAQTVQTGTQWAWQRNQDLANALAMSGGVSTSNVTAARLDIQNALSTALGNARAALNAFYGPSPATPGAPPTATPTATAPGGVIVPFTRPAVGSGGFPVNVQTAAQQASIAMAADPNYCTSVAQPGSGVNAAVHTFKTAWNASMSPAVPVGTGNYEAATALALAQVLGAAPPACGARQPVAPPPSPITPPRRAVPVAAATTSSRLSTGEVVGVALLGATAIGGVTYLVTRRQPARAQRRSSYRY